MRCRMWKTQSGAMWHVVCGLWWFPLSVCCVHNHVSTLMVSIGHIACQCMDMHLQCEICPIAARKELTKGLILTEGKTAHSAPDTFCLHLTSTSGPSFGPQWCLPAKTLVSRRLQQTLEKDSNLSTATLYLGTATKGERGHPHGLTVLLLFIVQVSPKVLMNWIAKESSVIWYGPFGKCPSLTFWQGTMDELSWLLSSCCLRGRPCIEGRAMPLAKVQLISKQGVDISKSVHLVSGFSGIFEFWETRKLIKTKLVESTFEGQYD